MEANSKLQKKKRIAHSHLSKSSFDGPKLPPDDFVYNIMKDMDSRNIMSYQLSKEIKSKERHDSSKIKGRKLENSSNRDIFCKKREKGLLPKKSFPLMQKCQTSLKYLNKNRCMPKPRAHVGLIPKPQVRPATYSEPGFSKYINEKCRESVKRTEIQSKAYSKVIESDLIRKSNIKSQQNETTENDLLTQDDNGCNYSSSEDGDAAYESFLQEVKEDNISSDSDSDSRVVIRRKRSKLKLKKKHKKPSLSNDGNDKCISKVTSIPLSDSSESQTEEISEANERLKRMIVSPSRLHKRVATDPLESFQSDSSIDQLPDLNTNNDSSDEDFGVQTAAANSNIKCTSDYSKTSISAVGKSKVKVSSFESFLKTTFKHKQMDQSPARVSVDSIAITNQLAIDKNVDIMESNELISSDSMVTKSVQKYQVPCCVRLKRDPIIDKKAETYCSTANYSAVDCIVISDESDNEVSTMSLSLTSVETPSFSAKNAHPKDINIQDSTEILNFDSSNFKDADDCLIMRDLLKEGSSNTLNSESMHCTFKSTSTYLNANLTIDEERTTTFTEINCEQSNSDEAASLVDDSTSKNIDEFKVQIVAVKSLVEQSDNSLIAKDVEVNEIEIIDLSDDDLNSQEIGSDNNNFESVKELDEGQHTKVTIEHNVNENNPFVPTDKNWDPQTPLLNPVQQSSCEESPVHGQKFANNKILEVLSKIDFDSIKEIINKTKSINAVEASTERETLMTNVEYHHNNKLSTERDLLDSNKNLSKTDTAMESASKANASEIVPAVNAVASGTYFTAKLNTELSNKIYVGVETTSILNSESNPVAISGTENRNVAMRGQQNEANNLPKTKEIPLIPVVTDNQLNSVTEMEIVEPKTIIDKGENKCLPRTIYDGKRKGIAIDDIPIIKKPKFEIFESPSDELDVIAGSFIKDLSTPNKTVDALLNLYEAEYSKYINIKNTEANVTLGLKMLHDKQLDKLTHLRASIKNLVRHDPCYHTVIQEKYDSKAQICIKNEANLQKNILIPSSSSEKRDISFHSKTNKAEVKHASCSSKETGSEIATHPNVTSDLEVKLTSSNEGQKIGILTQSEVKEKPLVKTAPKEKFLKYMQNIKCAECGKPATARCQGCGQVFYCSSQCGVLSWKKGHNVACKRSRM